MATTYELIVKAVDQTSSPLGKVQATLVETDNKTKKLAKSLKGLGGSAVKTSLKALTGGLKSSAAAATVAAVAFTALAKRNLNALDAIGKTADKLGVSTQFLTEYGEVAERAGLSTEQFQTGLQRFIRRLGQAQAGTGELLKPLKEMGISIKNSSGGFRDGVDVFDEFINKLGETSNKSRQLALAMGAFDTEGVAFVNIAAMGTKQINAFREAARQAGIVIGRDLTQDAAKANDAISQLLDVARGFQLQFFGALAKPIQEAVEALRNNMIIRVEAAGGMEQFARRIASSFLSGVATLIESTAKFIDNLKNAFAEFTNIMKQIIVAISNIPGIGFTAAFGDKATIRANLELEKAEAQAKLDSLGEVNPFAKMTRSGQILALAIAKAQAEVIRIDESIAALESGDMIFFEKMSTDSTSASDAVKGLVDRTRTLADIVGQPAVETYADHVMRIAQASEEARKAEEQRQAVLRTQLNELLPKASAAVKALMTDEEKLQNLYNSKKQLLGEINTMLGSDVKMTQDQRTALNNAADALQREINLLGERIKMGATVAEIYHSTEKALRANTTERGALQNAITQLTAQMQSEQFQTEKNKAVLQALNDALDENAAARRRLLGIPLTDEELTANLSEQLKLREDQIAQNNRVFQQMVAENDLTAKQIELLRTLTGIPKPDKDPFALMSDPAAADLAQKTFEFRQAQEAQNQRIFDQLSKELTLTKEQTEALREQLGLQTEMSALDNFKKGILDQRKAFDSLNISVEEQKRLAEELNVPYFKLRQQMLQATAGMDMFKSEAQLLAEGIEQQFYRVSQTIGQTLAGAIVEGRNMGDALKNIFKQTLTQILGMIIQSGINRAIAGLFGGMGGMGGGSIFGMLLGIPGLAAGGVASGGRPYLVGEEGPELFMPGTTGRVVPNEETVGANTGGALTININAIDTQSGAEFIVKNKRQIESVVQNAYNKRGKRGIA